MRVLHVISGIDASNGGPTTALLGLTNAQVAAGHDVQVVATWQAPTGPANAPTFEREGVRVTMVGPARGKLSRHPDLRATVERAVADADAVHVHALWEQPQHEAMLATHAQGVPCVVRACGGLHPWSLAQGRWRKRLYLSLRLRGDLNRASALLFTTPTERDHAAPLRLSSPAIVEPNGTELAGRAVDRSAARDALCHRFPQIADGPVLLFLGRIHPKKGLDVLLPAFVAAHERGMRATLLLAGPEQDPATAAMVRRLAGEAGVTDRVIFTGLLDRPATVDALAGSDLLTLTSHTENFGIAVVEALAVGTPVLISDRVEAASYMKGADVGAVVPLDVETVAAALLEWTADGERRRAAGERGQRLARKTFDWTAIADRWIGHYRRLSRS